MVRGNRGILRIIEATVAILIIVSVLLIVGINQGSKIGVDYSEELRAMLADVAQNSGLREEILANRTTEVKEFLRTKINEDTFGFEIKICEADEVCTLDNFPEGAGEDLFAESRIISTTLESTEFNPKKITIFLWKKS